MTVGVFGVGWRALMSGVVALGATLMLAGGMGSGAGPSVAAPAPPAPVVAEALAPPPTLPAVPAVPATPSGLWFPVVEPATTRVVSTLIGGDGAEDTAGRLGVRGADLGHVFLHRGKLAVLFGDTYGAPPADPFFSVPHQDRRGSTLGWLDARGDLGPAIGLADMVTDRPGHAEELLSSQH